MSIGGIFEIFDEPHLSSFSHAAFSGGLADL